jgi:Cu/Ag efflux pump CusA
LLITTRDGRPVYVRDLADISFATDRHGATRRHGGRSEDGADGAIDRTRPSRWRSPSAPAPMRCWWPRRSSNAPRRWKGSLIPNSMAVEVTRDYGETANEKANELLYHLGLATVSIIVLVWLAIGWREALVVAVVIPVTILLTLFASLVMGYTLNRVSLFALIFSIGILVDDAIVVIENIARHWGMGDGRERKQAAIEAVAEVGNPTIVATLTVVAALLPMLFVSGMMGPYMSPIPANASAAMVFSFFVAVMVTPWLMLKIAGRAPMHHGHAEPKRAHGGVLGRIYRAVARPVLASKTSSWIFLLVVGVLTLGSLSLFYTKDVTVKLCRSTTSRNCRWSSTCPKARRSRRPTRLPRPWRAKCSSCPRSSNRYRPMPGPPRRSTSTGWCGIPSCARNRRWAMWRST